MARSTTAGIGHNTPELTDDDRAALVAYFGMNIRNKRAIAAAKKAEAAAAGAEVNKLFATVKGQLGFIRYKFEELLDAQDMDEDEFLATEAERHALFKLGGLEPGQQLDLLERLKDTVDDQTKAYSAGRMAVRKGGIDQFAVPPETMAPILHQDWLRGWHDETAVIGAQMARAEEIIAAAAAPAEPEVDPEDEEAGEDFDADEEARRLKRSGFMETAAEDDDHAAAA